MVIYPAALSPGDSLIAVSPASPITPEGFDRGREALAAEGFKVEAAAHALRRGEYLAGSDQIRALDIQQAFLDAAWQGIICTRGGYGSGRTLPYLDYQKIALHPKWFIGFSDITALNLALWQRCRLVTLSGMQLVKGWGESPSVFARQSWLDTVTGYIWNKALPYPETQTEIQPICRRSGEASGRLLGGNLAVLSSLVGTPFTPRFSSSILLLEEIDEPPYRIDRMLTQLAQAGAFKGVCGIVLGDFTQHTRNGDKNLAFLAASILEQYIPNVPVLAGVPYGHIRDSWTLPIGCYAELDADELQLTLFRD